MKKYDWDKQLRRELNALPEDERETILDYYNEIFEDKRDRGERETEIIASFGSPYAVADKILKESRGVGTLRGDASNSEPSGHETDDRYEFQKAEFSEDPYGPARTYHPSTKIPKETRSEEFRVVEENTGGGGGKAALVILIILLWIPVFTVSVAGFAVLFALVTVFAALIAGGGYIAVLGIIDAATGAGIAAGLVEIGTGILIAGIGFLLCPLCLWFGKIVWRLLKSACGAFGKWIRGRKAA